MVRLATFIVLVLVTSARLQAGLLIDTGPASSLNAYLGGDYVAGTEFTTTSSLTIRSLGWLDAEGDGLAGIHKVGLWDTTTETLLATATVTSASTTVASAQGQAQWYMEGITPVVLAPGSYRVAGEVGADLHNARTTDSIGNGVTLSSGYVRTDFPSGGFNYPNLELSYHAIRATASTDPVLSSGAPLPEPSSLACVLAVVCGGGFFNVRRRRAASHAALPSH